MILSPIVLKLRAYFESIESHRIGNRVAGAAELAAAYKGTLNSEIAFVIQLADNAGPNPIDQGINQKLTDRIGVIVAIKNDMSDADKIGITAYDSLHTLRAEIFKAILGWQVSGAESFLYYRGGRLLNLTPAWLWYQFEFEVYSRLTDEDGIDMGDLADFDSIYADYVLFTRAEGAHPETGAYSYPATNPDMQQYINLDQEAGAGGFGLGFATGFDFYDI